MSGPHDKNNNPAASECREHRHKLLCRQLRRTFGNEPPRGEVFQAFLRLVNKAYTQFEEDLALLERSLELSSDELLIANSELRAIFESLPDLFLRLDGDSRVLDAQGGGEMTTFPPNSLLGSKLREHPDLGGAFLERVLGDVLLSQTPQQVDLQIQKEENATYYEARFLPFMRSQVICVLRDVTEIRLAEQNLRESEARKGAILESALDCIITMDHEFRILEFNPAAGRTFQWSSMPMFGQDFFEIALAPHSQKIFSRQALASGARWEVEAMDSQGRTFPMEIAMSTIFLHNRPLYTAYIRDITERKSAEQELKQHKEHLEELVEERTSELAQARDNANKANRAKSDFLARMSHELRTPLNAIIGYSEMMQEEAIENEIPGFRLDLERVLEAARNLLELINDILDLSKIEAGHMEVTIERFDVSKLIHSVITTIQPLAKKNNNRLLLLFDKELQQTTWMTSDQGKLRQILQNLLSNACKFTSGGEIALEVQRQVDEEGDAWFQFRVRDSGVGMTKKQIDIIFQAFTQADSEISRRFGGTGLGLTITRSFCGMLGGDIVVESQPDVGSTFIVQLPARYSPQQARFASFPMWDSV